MANINATAGAANSGDRQGIGSRQEQPPELTRPIADIQVGQRHRRELGDVDSLARSIADVGLLHPVVIAPDGMLIAGERRLEAYKRLGRDSVPVHIVCLDEIARGELAENAERKDFLPSEIEAIRRALAPKVATPVGRPKKVESFHHFDVGKTRDKVGAFAGVSGRTVEKIAAVVEAAEAEPERFGKLLADMDRTGRVNGIYKRLKIAQQAQAIRAAPPPLPGRGPYSVMVSDPPWPYEIRREDPSHRATYPYPAMSIAEICALDVASLAAADSVLWLWTTNYHMLNGARSVLDAWGFAPVTILTWAKDRMGMGAWLRGQTEHCIFATRGKPLVMLTNQTTLLNAPVRGHSVKPIEFYDLIESLCPASRYADIFSRYRHNDKWDCHGDQAPAAVADDLSIPGFLRRGVAP